MAVFNPYHGVVVPSGFNPYEKGGFLMSFDDGFGATSHWVRNQQEALMRVSQGWEISGMIQPKQAPKAPVQTEQKDRPVDLKRRIVGSDVDQIDRKRRGGNYQFIDQPDYQALKKRGLIPNLGDDDEEAQQSTLFAL